MRLGLMIGYSGAKFDLPLDTIQEADRLGYYAVWTAEAYGSDSVTPLAWIGARTEKIHLGTAIMQMPARTPAMTAMTAIFNTTAMVIVLASSIVTAASSTNRHTLHPTI